MAGLLLLAAIAAGVLYAFADYLLAPEPYRMQFDPELPGDLTPSTTVTVDGSKMQDKRKVEQYFFSFSVNSLGFRGLEVELGDGVQTVMTIGDGYGFGTSVDGDHTMCDELNRMFKESSSVRRACVNASLPGMNLVDEYEYLKEKGHRLKPEFFVIVMSWDDVWEMARPVQMRELLKCVAHSRRCVLKVMYHRFVNGIFHMKDMVMKSKRMSEEMAYRKLLGGYLGLMGTVRDYVGGWGGRVLIVTEAIEFEALRLGLQELEIPLIVLTEGEGSQEVEHAVDGHWSAATHMHAASRVLEYIQTETR